MKDLKTIQRNELIILKEIKRICVKFDITYYLSSGTLLGAVRHKGFIPWDDDIDIEMPLKDYKRFIEICKTELNSRFFLQNYKTEMNDYHAFTKVRMNNTTFLPSHHKKYHIHHGFWVDVFPVVNMPKNRLLQIIKKKILMVSNYIQIGDYVLANYDEFRKKLGEIGITAVLAFNKLPVNLRVKLHTILLLPIMRNPKKNHPLAIVWTAYDALVPNTFVNLVDLEFEDELFKCPQNYDNYLKNMFGDYMQLPPESERNGHGSFIVYENKDYSEFIL